MPARDFDRLVDQGAGLGFRLCGKRVRNFPAQALELLVRPAQAFERLDVDERSYGFSGFRDDDSSAPISNLVQQVAQALSHRHGRGFFDHR